MAGAWEQRGKEIKACPVHALFAPCLEAVHRAVQDGADVREIRDPVGLAIEQTVYL